MHGTWMVGAALSLSIAAAAAAVGPEWVEGQSGTGDAGTTSGDAQSPTGSGTMSRIRGQLTGLSSGALGTGEDLDDVYVICIEDPLAFTATTAMGSAFSEFDSRLYLFSLDGFGLLGNNIPMTAGVPLDGEVVSNGATLENTATDATGVIVNDSGLYLLAITVAPRQPTSGGQPIFFFAAPDEISGPDGPGGGGPLEQWQPVGPIGACCLADESCGDMNPADCAVFGGIYQGDGTSCAGVDCIGACFLPSRACIETSEANCDDLDGFYDGNGTTCGGAAVAAAGPMSGEEDGEYVIMFTGVCFPESVPTGACVMTDGSCTIITQVDCDDLGGTWLGPDSECPDVTAPDVQCAAVVVGSGGGGPGPGQSTGGCREGAGSTFEISYGATDDSGSAEVSAVIDLGCDIVAVESGQLIDLDCFDPGSQGFHVTICHIPPGRPSNAHTIMVGAPAVAAHLAHGDFLGCCEGNCIVDQTNGMLRLRSDAAVLIVTATDPAGNTATCEIDLCPDAAASMPLEPQAPPLWPAQPFSTRLR